MNTIQGNRITLVAILAVIGAAASANAGLIGVNAPPSGEASHQQIITSTYGGSFSGAPATGFTGSGASSGISIVRTEDFGNGGTRNVNGVGSVSDDTIWAGGIISARAIGRYAGYNQTFGYLSGSGNSLTYNNLFNVGGSETGVSGSVTDINLGSLTGGSWRWARSGDNGVHSSRPSDNVDGLDHMVTYRVNGLNNGKITWLLFFEDLNESQCPDWDYNDLAIEVTTTVPTPGAVTLAGLSGLLVVAGRRRKSR
ncbi:MAG TPA: hypothetical protein VG797_02825 [Phycisphaerales bacterium]|nr:hypothetical protein [Phycisphaerales bacterium]